MWSFISSGGSRVDGVVSDRLSVRLLPCLYGGPSVELIETARCQFREALTWNLVHSVGSRIGGDVFVSFYVPVHRWRSNHIKSCYHP